MGLAVEVGYLADLLKNDAEGAGMFQNQLQRLNEYLASEQLAPHSEPTQCKIFSCEVYGYSGLHYLRRIAAHLDLRSGLPPPGNENASKDPVVAEYHRFADGKQKLTFFGGLFKKSLARHFDHLMLHSDADGYYLPRDFAKVLFPPKTFGIAGGMVGSSHRLAQECERLAAALKLPTDLDPESDVVQDAMESQGKGDTQWQRYGIESYVCLQVLKACKHSIATGAAIVFC
jgi:hypothetical protein